MLNRYYTGVGSRKTPKDVQAKLTVIAFMLAKLGYTLRSGGAEGADTAFELGAKQHVVRSPSQPYDIYLPYEGFNGRYDDQFNYHRPGCESKLGIERNARAKAIAADIHPAWQNCDAGARAFHTRNVFQVLGHDLESPSRFLICWAPTDKKGIPTGGTATAWNLARKHGVPCYNISRQFDYAELMVEIETFF